MSVHGSEFGGNRFKVYYPYGGKRWLLQWSTPEERDHVIIGSSPAQVEMIAERVFQKHPRASVVEYMEAELVGPTPKMHDVYAELVWADRVQALWRFVKWGATDHLKEYGELPPGIEGCPGFEAADPRSLPDKWDREHHYDCKNCDDGVRLTGRTKKEMYEARGAAFEEMERERIQRTYGKLPKDPRVESRAEPARDGELLWAAVGHHGPHSHGTYLRKLLQEDEWDSDRSPWFFYQPLLFLFHKIGDVDRSHIEALGTVAVTKYDLAQAECAMEYQRQRDADKAQRLADLRKVLGL